MTQEEKIDLVLVPVFRKAQECDFRCFGADVWTLKCLLVTIFCISVSKHQSQRVEPKLQSSRIYPLPDSLYWTDKVFPLSRTQRGRKQFDGSILMFHWQKKLFSQGGAVEGKENKLLIRWRNPHFNWLMGDFSFRKHGVTCDSGNVLMSFKQAH